jgi:hypothetical protein
VLCSKCSEIIRPIFVFDIDGTFAMYHERLYQFNHDYQGLGIGGHQPPPYDWDGSGDFEDYLGITKPQYREMKLAFRQGGQKRMMDPYEDMIHLWLHIVQTYPSAEVWIATHRPWRRLDNIDPDTQFWLRRFNISYTKLIFSEDKYLDLFTQVDSDRIVACFEDLGEMCDRAEQLDLPVRQVARPHNRCAGESRPHRGTVAQLVTWVDDQAADWYERNRSAE